MIAQPFYPADTLGTRIARLRAGRGWTQEDLAVRLAASRVAVSHFELGLAVPSERTVVLLAGLFKLEPHELVAETNYPSAKAERLPSVACRYTEAEMLVALVQRDREWAAQSGDATVQNRVAAESSARIARLLAETYDRDERALLEAALALFSPNAQPGLI